LNIESKARKHFIVFKFEWLKPGGINTGVELETCARYTAVVGHDAGWPRKVLRAALTSAARRLDLRCAPP
jgi:hypothetical protein